MKISVAMCTYNGEKYLEEQINSILSQTVLPDEIIICDDCSNDNTRTILEEINNDLIKIHYNSNNLGSTCNFEQAIKMCTGDIIFLSDQDDVWVNTKIETILKVLNSSRDIYGVFTNAFVTDEQLNPTKLSLWDYVDFNYKTFDTRILFEKNVVTGATMAFKKEALEWVFPLHPEFVHDEWMVLIMTLIYPKGIVPINEKLIYYRSHSSQQIGININQRKSLLVKLRIKIFGVSARHLKKRQYFLQKYHQIINHLYSLGMKSSCEELVEYTTYIETRIDISQKKSLLKRLKFIRRIVPLYLKYDNFIVVLKDLMTK